MLVRFGLFSIFCVFLICAILYLTLAILTGRSPQLREYSEADIDFFASDAHVVIAGVPLVVPFIALRGYVTEKPSFSLDKKRDRDEAKRRLDEFRNAASNSRTAPDIDTLEIGIRTFGWDDRDMSLTRICSRLKREWSKSVCNDPWAPIQQAVPNDFNEFYLTDIRRLETFSHHWTVGGERKSDQIPVAKLEVGKPSIVCDKSPKSKTNFCTASMLVKGHLAIVWSVYNGEVETAQQQAERQARAITALVIDGFGPSENFPRLLAVACNAKRPGAPVGIRPSPCRFIDRSER